MQICQRLPNCPNSWEFSRGLKKKEIYPGMSPTELGSAFPRSNHHIVCSVSVPEMIEKCLDSPGCIQQDGIPAELTLQVKGCILRGGFGSRGAARSSCFPSHLPPRKSVLEQHQEHSLHVEIRGVHPSFPRDALQQLLFLKEMELMARNPSCHPTSPLGHCLSQLPSSC